MRTRMITVLAFGLSLILATGLIAEDKLVLPHSVLLEREFTADYSKPGGIVIGPAMPRAFHYGGRQTVRDANGILHATWEDPTYDFNYYAHSLDTLGLEWTDPINPHLTYGVELEDGSLLYELDRALMAKMAMDPRTGYLYMMPFHRLYAGERYKTGITRSTDNGDTWAPYLDLGGKINRPTEEVSWGTMTIGYDPNDANKTIMHIVYAKDNVDAMYTRADLSVIDSPTAALSDLTFTRSDGLTAGDEAISFVPSGVVFQGTIILDRNNDPHIIFSGDGGSDTFGDKTPYHIYFKSAANAWGPIPPQQLMQELEQSWGMPEMVFDQNNRGYYFLDKNDPYGAATFGTWEPPTNPTSATDFGTLNATGETYGFQAALDLIDENFPNLEILSDDDLYLPQADVDDANDVVYVAANTNSYSSGNGGDIVILALENASQYSHSDPPSAMDWTIYRWVTSDGIGLGDVGADLIYDPSSSKIDIFWSGAGATDNEAQYLPAHIPPPDLDAQAVSISINIPNDKPEANEGDVIEIIGAVKNGGLSPFSPVPVIAQVLDSNDVAVFTGNYTAPPLAPGAETPDILFGTWVVEGAHQDYSVTLTVDLAGDQASYNNSVGMGFFAYPSLDDTYGSETWDDTTNYTNIPTVDANGVELFAGYAGGWTVVDSSNGPFADERDDYINTWFFDDDDNNALDQHMLVRHMQGVRNDTIFGDIPPPTGVTVEEYAQPQNELLFSPFYQISGSVETHLHFDDAVNASLDLGSTIDSVIAKIDMSVDGGVTWIALVHRLATLDGTPEDMIMEDLDWADIDLSSHVSGVDSVQFRFHWINTTNDGSYATWEIDNVYVVEHGTVGIDPADLVPTEYALSQNYPNPFNPSTRISFSLPQATKVQLYVHNLLGQTVKTVVNAQFTQGTHTVTVDASELSAGIYFYTLKTADFTETKKLVLLK